MFDEYVVTLTSENVSDIISLLDELERDATFLANMMKRLNNTNALGVFEFPQARIERVQQHARDASICSILLEQEVLEQEI